MLLNEEFSYVCLDFETTGLDFQKDEPIQLGIVKMNEKGEIIRFCDIWNNIPKKYFPEVENIWWWQKDYAGALMEVLKPLITLRRESRQKVGRLI